MSLTVHSVLKPLLLIAGTLMLLIGARLTLGAVRLRQHFLPFVFLGLLSVGFLSVGTIFLASAISAQPERLFVKAPELSGGMALIFAAGSAAARRTPFRLDAWWRARPLFVVPLATWRGLAWLINPSVHAPPVPSPFERELFRDAMPRHLQEVNAALLPWPLKVVIGLGFGIPIVLSIIPGPLADSARSLRASGLDNALVLLGTVCLTLVLIVTGGHLARRDVPRAAAWVVLLGAGGLVAYFVGWRPSPPL